MLDKNRLRSGAYIQCAIFQNRELEGINRLLMTGFIGKLFYTVSVHIRETQIMFKLITQQEDELYFTGTKIDTILRLNDFDYHDQVGTAPHFETLILQIIPYAATHNCKSIICHFQKEPDLSHNRACKAFVKLGFDKVNNPTAITVSLDFSKLSIITQKANQKTIGF